MTEQGPQGPTDLGAPTWWEALKRAVARLEQDGLVSRGTCADDRRAIFVCVTEEGRRLHGQARPTHREVLRRTD